jgi:hypothetical protein
MSGQTVIQACDWCGEHAIREIVVEPAKFATRKLHGKTVRVMVQAERKRWVCADHVEVKRAVQVTPRRGRPGPEQGVIT